MGGGRQDCPLTILQTPKARQRQYSTRNHLGPGARGARGGAESLAGDMETGASLREG